MSPLDGANRYETIHVGGTNSRVVCGPLNTVYNAPVINKLQRSDSYELRETRKAVLDWLSPLTFQEFHNTIQDTTPIRKANCEHRGADRDFTGKWLLETKKFQEWKARELQNLWYYGMRKYRDAH